MDLRYKRIIIPFGKKKCSLCQEIKNIEEFQNNRTSKDGKRNYCKKCSKISDHKKYLNNRENIINRERLKRNTDDYREKAKIRSKTFKRKEWSRKYRKNKRKTNMAFRLRCNLASRIWDALTGKTKAAKTIDLLGMSINKFKNYLESKFQPGMTWDNYGYYGWHVDHIKACCKFDLSKPEEQYKCFHYTNLQPMWGKDNFKKQGY